MNAQRTDPLRVHGDRFAGQGLLDFAVNVWPTPRPPALREALSRALEETGYPDDTAALQALARRHGRPAEQILLLAGACEAFWLLAHTLPVRHAVCVHPSFTEGEAALRATGAEVTRIFRSPDDWSLQPEQVPEDADLVVLANPNNPTGNLDPPAQIARLARPGRTLLLDESFIDFVPGERASLADAGALPGLIVLRSLTKLWGLASLRAGYLLAAPELVARLAAQRQPWSLSTPALAAIEICASDRETPSRVAAEVAAARHDLCERLAEIPAVKLWPSQANFLLIEVPDGPEILAQLAARAIAVRPCESFPGLTPNHLRLAVRTPAEHATLAAAISDALESRDPARARTHAGPRATRS